MYILQDESDLLFIEKGGWDEPRFHNVNIQTFLLSLINLTTLIVFFSYTVLDFDLQQYVAPARLVLSVLDPHLGCRP